MERSPSSSDSDSDDCCERGGHGENIMTMMNNNNNNKAAASVEEGFAETEVPRWTEQITVRAIATSVALSVLFSFIVCKLNLTTGVVPSLNVAAGLIGFAVLKGYTALLAKAGLLKHPFTRQENTVVQTCVVASSGIAFSSGTASYLLGMSPIIAAQAKEGNTPINVKTLSLGWMIGFLFVVSFVGLFSIVPLRKMMIMKFKLPYPSGTATAYLINSFHTTKGARLAKKQVSVLSKAFCFSFGSAFFQWFFAAADGCGFSNFPTFGLQALAQRFYFDFSMTYVGVGMICPYMVSTSVLLGAVISWGIMWPLIEQKKGVWYSADLSPSSLRGIQGYRVFISIAMMLGDGLFHLLFLLLKTVHSLITNNNNNNKPSEVVLRNSSVEDELNEKRRTEYFLKDQIPVWAAVLGYIALALLSTVAVPQIFPQLAWHHVMVVYVAAPVLAFCNAYGCGLTDWSMASNYGKLAIVLFAAWVGPARGGIVAGLAACGVAMGIVSSASDLMQDFKTGYLTLASPRAMFLAQAAGTAVGCVVSPLAFWVFHRAYPVGLPGGSYPAPYAVLYRGIALVGAEGLGSFPEHCLALSAGFCALALALNAAREALLRLETKRGLYRFVPSPMCLAIPFYLGGFFGVDMCLGGLVLFLWRRVDQRRAGDYAPAVASGLICGESLWGIPAALLALAGVKAPICMKFLSASVNNKVDSFLGQ